MCLQEYSAQIEAAVVRSNMLYENGVNTIKQALKSEKEAGDLLIEVKKSLPHGQFLNWIKNNCTISERHAQRLMKIASHWDEITAMITESKSDMRVGFESLPTLTAALAIARVAEAKANPDKYGTKPQLLKVASTSHDCYNEVVTVVEELHQGDVLVCQTKNGRQPFLRKELVSPDTEIEEIVAEIVEETTLDKSEELREALAIIVEHFPEDILQEMLKKALFIGQEHLPEGIRYKASKLLIGKKMFS